MKTLADKVRARSRLFQLLALGFAHPVEAFHRVLVDGSYCRAVLAAAAGARCGGQLVHQEVREFSDFEADYIHLFQLGRGGKPLVPLSAGDHDQLAQGQGRPEFLLEYSGWYRHFGLRVNTDENANELPDHLACQLEFMAWLAHLEESADDAPELQQGYRRAQRDFLQRHLQPFLVALTGELQNRCRQPRINPFYLALAGCALAVTDSVLAQLEGLPAASDQPDATGNPEQLAAVNLWG